MNIAGLYNIVFNRNHELWTDVVNGEWKSFEDPVIIRKLFEVLKYARSKSHREEILKTMAEETQQYIINAINDWKHNFGVPSNFNGTLNEFVESLIQKLIDFFSEFGFEPNFRFINTFGRQSKIDQAKEYCVSYFKLIDSPYTNDIINKLQSKEFEQITAAFKLFKFDRIVNTRFKLYYGSQGTGKTTLACEEANGNVIVCHSAMLPSDLMEDFQFINGQPHFTPSALQDAIVNGKKIVLDEVNLLPFESLRFLQSILDGKKEFTYKGKVINIHEEFHIIGTMNLVVNGCVYSLPEPLVDRAEELKEFKLTAKSLIGAIL